MKLNRLAVNLIFMVNGFIYANWIARLPRVQEIYHLNNQALGLVLLFVSMGAISSMPFTGWLIHKNSSRSITLFGAIAFCLLVPGIPLLPEVWQVRILFYLVGVSAGLLDVAMNAQAVLVEQKYQKPIMSSFHALFSVGMMLGAGSGALFAKFNIPLFTHLVCIVGVCLVLILWAARHLIPDAPQAGAAEQGAGFRLPTKAILSVGIIAFCGMTGEGAIADWSSNYMENVAKANEALAPLALAAFSLAMTIGRLFGDRIRESLGDKRLLIYSGCIAFVGLALALAIPAPLMIITGFLVIGLGLATVVPIAYSIAGNAPGLPPGVGLSMVTTVGYAGFLFGPPIIGFLADWQSLRVALLFVVFLFTVMTFLSFRSKF
ncbi:MFS transporter [Adhaeribacter pallidiroseus]|uniref:Membrane protein MosC n=1 Tax=Adhaeribacter pallidiroseus TaxID=2072847 RepID=A0A369QE61_9BACT|nr:MFS transporter [Adhaeribacter pallidiroseus]RDC63201.1 Membrane protein MosC [Adhaeribacter pallidiroseus]